MLRWEVLLHPAAYAEAIAAHPPLGAATLLLLTLTTLWALCMLGMEQLLDHKQDRDLRSQLGYWSRAVFLPLLLLILWILITFCTLGIERWIGHVLSFEALFCLLLIAAVPRFVSWILYAFREISLPVLYTWRGLSVALLLVTTERIWVTMSAANPLPWWQSLLTVVPCLAAVWATSLWEIFEQSDSLRAAYPWRRVAGKRVCIFYPRGKAQTEVEEIVREADILVAQIEQMLNVKPVPFRIPIFLCANSEDLRRLNDVTGRLSAGYAGAGHISLVYESWKKISSLVAHELTHVVAKQRLKQRLMPLLNEGLAEYGREQMIAGSTRAAICLPLPLGTLAHTHIFYEWRYVEEPDYPAADKYAHAAALADYLIGRYGMDKFKELCLQTAHADQAPASQFQKAVTTVYGLSLRQLEQNWRREWIGPGKIRFEHNLPDEGIKRVP